MSTLLFFQMPVLLASHALLRLRQKLAIASVWAVILTLGCVAFVVADHLEDALVSKAGADTAFFMDSFVEPHIQGLAHDATLSEAARDALERVLSPVSMGRPVVGFRIWVDDRIAFSNEHYLIGKQYPPSKGRMAAFAGRIAAEIDRLSDDDDAQLAALNVPLLEVYAPVRMTGSGRILAVAETYEIALELRRSIWIAQLAIFFAAGLICVGLLLLARRYQQRRSAMTMLRAENAQIRNRVSEASQRVSELNENYMRRVGSELYSGPMQLIALALLKFDRLRELVVKANASAGHGEDLTTIERALHETLSEIRKLSASMIPSQVEALGLAKTIAMAARRHEKSTGFGVTCTIDDMPTATSYAVRACAYRFVQEGLEMMPPGAKVVWVTSNADSIEIRLKGGASIATCASKLRDCRDRVEAMGGQFLLREDDNATVIAASLVLCDLGDDDV